MKIWAYQHTGYDESTEGVTADPAVAALLAQHGYAVEEFDTLDHVEPVRYYRQRVSVYEDGHIDSQGIETVKTLSIDDVPVDPVAAVVDAYAYPDRSDERGAGAGGSATFGAATIDHRARIMFEVRGANRHAVRRLVADKVGIALRRFNALQREAARRVSSSVRL